MSSHLISSHHARSRMAMVKWGRISGSDSKSIHDMGPYRRYRSRNTFTALLLLLLPPPWLFFSAILVTVSGHKIPCAMAGRASQSAIMPPPPKEDDPAPPTSPHSSSSKSGPTMCIFVIVADVLLFVVLAEEVVSLLILVIIVLSSSCSGSSSSSSRRSMIVVVLALDLDLPSRRRQPLGLLMFGEETEDVLDSCRKADDMVKKRYDPMVKVAAIQMNADLMLGAGDPWDFIMIEILEVLRIL